MSDYTVVQHDHRKIFFINEGPDRSFEIHYAVVGEAGAVCLRTDTGLRSGRTLERKPPVLGWHSLTLQKGSNVMEECPLLEGQKCWFKKAKYGAIELEHVLTSKGLNELWQQLENRYDQIQSEGL